MGSGAWVPPEAARRRGGTCGKDYDIQFSDDNANWTTAKAVRGGNGQADVVELTGTGRYVRMQGVATGNASYGYSLYEFTICAA